MTALIQKEVEVPPGPLFLKISGQVGYYIHQRRLFKSVTPQVIKFASCKLKNPLIYIYKYFSSTSRLGFCS